MSLLRVIADQFESRDSESRTPTPEPGVTTPFFPKTRPIDTFNCASKKTSGRESDPQNPRANQNRPWTSGTSRNDNRPWISRARRRSVGFVLAWRASGARSRSKCLQAAWTSSSQDRTSPLEAASLQCTEIRARKPFKAVAWVQIPLGQLANFLIRASYNVGLAAHSVRTAYPSCILPKAPAWLRNLVVSGIFMPCLYNIGESKSPGSRRSSGTDRDEERPPRRRPLLSASSA